MKVDRPVRRGVRKILRQRVRLAKQRRAERCHWLRRVDVVQDVIHLRAKAHHEAALNLGVALQELGELEPALDAYALAYRLRPDSFGRIAQSLVSGRVGALWLDPARLRQRLAGA